MMIWGCRSDGVHHGTLISVTVAIASCLLSFWVHWGIMLPLICSRLSFNGKNQLSPRAGDGGRTLKSMCELRFFSCSILDFSFRNISCDLPLGVFPFPSFFRKARVCESQWQYHLRRCSTLMKARLRITIDGHEFEPDRPCQDKRKQLSTYRWRGLIGNNHIPETRNNLLINTEIPKNSNQRYVYSRQDEQEHTIHISIVLLCIASDPWCSWNLRTLANGTFQTRHLFPLWPAGYTKENAHLVHIMFAEIDSDLITAVERWSWNHFGSLLSLFRYCPLEYRFLRINSQHLRYSRNWNGRIA